MKYLVLIPDGAADRPVDALGGRTPLEAAATPVLDRLAREGEVGLVRTVPPGMAPGSDVANLSLFGYDPAAVYTGRAPLEAASMGIDLTDGDVAFRCNLVSLDGRCPEEDGAAMADYSAGHIGTDEGRRLIGDFAASAPWRAAAADGMELHPGVGYRHLLIWRGGDDAARCTPPHDVIGEDVAAHLPDGPAGARLRRIMTASCRFFASHAVNRERRERGLAGADSVWLWGQGRRPTLRPFREATGLSGAVISAVDLVNGIGALAGLERVAVPGATGYLDTDYGAKARYALEALERRDVVFVHIEAPDEAGHQGEARAKVSSLEEIDRRFLAPVLAWAEGRPDARILVAPDHPTPLALRTHAADPVPFLVWPAAPGKASGAAGFSEETARASGVTVEEGHRLLSRLLARP